MPEFYQRVPGERSDQATRRAQHLYRQAASFEKQVELHAAGDVNVDPRMNVSLSGTGTEWDGTYYIHAITYIFDQPQGASNYGGFTMTIEGRTADADSSPGTGGDPGTAGGGPESAGGDTGAPVGSSKESPASFDEAGFE